MNNLKNIIEELKKAQVGGRQYHNHYNPFDWTCDVCIRLALEAWQKELKVKYLKAKDNDLDDVYWGEAHAIREVLGE